MRVQVASGDDFASLVRPAYDRLRGTVPPEPASLEVVVAPGDYRGVHLGLGLLAEPGHVAVTIRAADPTRPPGFRNSSLRLHGRSVRLEHLVLHECYNSTPSVAIAVTETAAIEGCAIIGCGLADRRGGSLIELAAAGGARAVNVSFADCWLIGNRARGDDRGELLRFDTAPPHAFGQVRFDNVAWLDNLAQVAIVPGATSALRLTDCVVVEPVAGSTTLPIFVAINSIDTALAVERTLIVANRLDRLVTTWSPQHQSPDDFQPVVIRDSELYLRALPEPHLRPGGFRLDRSPLKPAPPRLDQPPSRTAVIAACQARAERGLAPDRARLGRLLTDQP